MTPPLSIDDRGPPPRPPDTFNLAGYVLAAGRKTPDKIALVRVGMSRAERWSYGRLAEEVAEVTGAFLARGIAARRRVILRLDDDPFMPVAFLAAAAADIVPVVLSRHLTAREVAQALTLTDPALMVADPGLPCPDTHVPVADAGTLRREGAGRGAAPVSGDPERAGYIVFTSGTSGVPRAVVHAHRAVYARRMMWEGWYGLGPGDRVLHAGAFNWTYTLGTGLLDPWAAGATALIPARGTEAQALPLLLERHEATIFAAAPGIYRRLLDRVERPRLTHLRHGLSAGEKLPEALRARWEAATGTPVHEAFGMSECSTFLSGAPARPAPAGTLGFAQPGRRIAVVDEDGAPVPRRTTGALAVARNDPGLMLGYLGAPEETARRHRGAWFVTGDAAEMRTDGAVIYHGRSDDMMNAGGIRVSPVEVEAALAAHSDVDDCAVTEVEVKADTRVIAAFVMCAGALDETALRAHMETRLASYKCPRIYVRVEALPRNANGKILRRELRAAHEAAGR